MRGAPASPALLLDVQRSAGNRAAVGLVHLQRTGCGCGGTCCQTPTHRDEIERVARVQRKAGGAAAANPLVHRGARGADVKSIQVNLNALGATPQLEPDGSFGPATEAAVKEFQGSHRLAPDGIVGQNTRAMLQGELAIEGANFLVPCHTADRPGPDTNRLGVDGSRQAPRVGNLLAAPGTGVKEDVTMLLTGEDISRTEAKAAGGAQEGPGGQVLTSVAGIQAALDRHPSIGTLAIVSHGGADGTVRLDTSNVFLTDLAKQLSQRPAGSIDAIVFLGCNIGKDRAGMLALKATLGAKSVEGSNCHLFASVTDPIAGVTKESQIPKRFTKKTWGEQVKRNCIGLAKEHQNCLVGLRPNFKTLVAADPEFLADLYFKNSGRMVFRFAQESGTCFDDLQFGKGDAAGCMRVQV